MKNRLIKFRAYGKKQGMFTPFIHTNGEIVPTAVYYNKEAFNAGVTPEELGDNEIDIMQFTGLKDKNGKEIYEGDILKVNNYSRGLLVKFGLCRGGGPNVTFKTLGWNLGKRGETLHDIAILEAEDGEIVGNIYENPELLKEHENN